eukprot:m.20412 g.20412  ORF g.20412 m.20412 type:complete len:129 (-) comp10546_c0_seq1:33-419(-)
MDIEHLLAGLSLREGHPLGVLINYKCALCRRTWWGARSNADCSRCKRAGQELPLEERVGLGHFRCDCGRTFVGMARGDVRSKCHGCQALVLPHTIEPPGQVKRKSNLAHHCELCDGHGNCPLKNRPWQ